MHKMLLNWNDVNNYTGEIIRQMVNQEWKPNRVVALTRGGLVPGVMISHYFAVPFTPLNVSLRDDSDGLESNLWLPEQALGLVRDGEDYIVDCKTASNILIVDDINDTGATIEWIKEDWKSSCMPYAKEWAEVWGMNIRVATLVQNLGSTSQSEYYAMAVDKRERDTWIEFPWENWWRT